MCKRAFILMLVLTIGAAAFVRLRLIARSHEAPHQQRHRPASIDVGAAMRQVTGTDASTLKPWVVDDLAFRNANTDRQWIVGRSDRPATSAPEAIEAARADAARQLYPVVRSRVKGWMGDRRWLQARVDSDVNAGRWDSDTFVERFDRPYGSVYAGSVLIDASADRIEPMVRSARNELAVRHRRAGMRMVIAGVLLIVTWLAYALLNCLTRGYLTTRLRVIAAAVTVGVLLLA